MQTIGRIQSAGIQSLTDPVCSQVGCLRGADPCSAGCVLRAGGVQPLSHCPTPLLLLLLPLLPLQLAQLVTSALLAGNIPTAANLLATIFIAGGTCAKAVSDGGAGGW